MDSGWVYGLLPDGIVAVPHWALAVAAVGSIGSLVIAWRYWRRQHESDVRRVNAAGQSMQSDMKKRIDRLSQQSRDLDDRLNAGLLSLRNLVLATEHRQADHLDAAITRLHDRQHADAEAAQATAAKGIEQMRQVMQSFHRQLQESLVRLSSQQATNTTRLDQLDGRVTRIEEVIEKQGDRVTALEIEQRSIAKATNGRTIVSDYLDDRRE